MTTIASVLDKLNWSIVKQLIYAEFQNSNIELYIYHNSYKNITDNWKSKEHYNVINNTHAFHENKNDQTKNTQIDYKEPKFNAPHRVSSQ
jgi:hypothetical protein